MTTTYKAWVQSQLQPLLAAGASQQQIAQQLGLKPNFLSMVLSEHYPQTQLPLARLPALCALCGLSAMESLRGVKQLISDGPHRGAHFDVPTFEWMLRCTAIALKECHGGV